MPKKLKQKTKQKAIYNESIFDTENLDDLPKSVQQKVLGRAYGQNNGNVLALFYIRPILTLDEIIVGLYRTAATEKSRNLMSSCLYQLIKKGILRRTGKGSYELVEKR